MKPVAGQVWTDKKRTLFWTALVIHTVHSNREEVDNT